ncbi:hypothetical protein, partial [Longispora fulva]|uniref:hypothetical protein n=1 Tax=Longispora fulva TaxID=619741 RepID=UPI00363487BA
MLFSFGTEYKPPKTENKRRTGTSETGTTKSEKTDANNSPPRIFSLLNFWIYKLFFSTLRTELKACSHGHFRNK